MPKTRVSKLEPELLIKSIWKIYFTAPIPKILEAKIIAEAQAFAEEHAFKLGTCISVSTRRYAGLQMRRAELLYKKAGKKKSVKSKRSAKKLGFDPKSIIEQNWALSNSTPIPEHLEEKILLDSRAFAEAYGINLKTYVGYLTRRYASLHKKRSEGLKKKK